MRIYGKDLLLQYFDRAISMDKVSHAYVLLGPRGVGKRTLAGYFARRLLCETGDDGCRCSSCVLFEAGNNPDLFYIKPSKLRLGVDDIREISEHMYVRPYRFSRKAFVVSDGDLMTEQAQNALLKILEEPPSYGVIFICVENLGNLLSTVLSRAVVLRVPAVSDAVMREFLSDSGVSDLSVLDMAACYGEGVLGRGLDIALSDDFRTIRQDMFFILGNIMSMDVVTLFESYKAFEVHKGNVFSCLSVLSYFFRDVLLFKDLSTRDFVLEREYFSLVERFSERVSCVCLCAILQCVEDTAVKLRANANFRLCIDLLLLNLKEFTYDRNRGNTV